jgi:predicted nucleic acid-binding protein
MNAVADTGPINYLVLIGEIELLPSLYQRVFLPSSVHEELTRPRSPETARAWLANVPGWLEVRAPVKSPDEHLAGLDAGERDVILLAEELKAGQVIIDELRGRQEAKRRQLAVTGTLGVLAAASKKGLVSLDRALQRLGQTGFRISQDILDSIKQAQNLP